MAPITTLPDQIESFLAKKRRKSPATYEQYRFVLEGIFLPWARAAGISDAMQVADDQLERFTQHLEARRHNGRPLSIPTLRTYTRVVLTFLKWAKVPRGEYEMIPAPDRMRDTLSRQEIDQMEAVALDERDRLMVRLLADTGIRLGELLGLREIDLRDDSHGRKYFIRVIGKGNREREVGIPQALFTRLRSFARGGASREYIFYGKRQRGGEIHRLTKSGVERQIRNLAKKAGIQRRVWPHLFRHSYITQMARKKVPLQDVMKAVGHRTPAMTMLIYSHTTPEDSYDDLMKALK